LAIFDNPRAGRYWDNRARRDRLLGELARRKLRLMASITNLKRLPRSRGWSRSASRLFSLVTRVLRVKTDRPNRLKELEQEHAACAGGL
jgi:hypothetical protein